MKKLIEDFTGPLVPQGLAEFAPNCSVCANKVPKRRNVGSGRDFKRLTCSAECERIYRLARQFKMQETQCKTCKRPTTRKEQEEFTKWRKARGEFRPGRGRPAGYFGPTRGAQLVEALKEASELLCRAERYILDKGGDFPAVEEAVKRFQILIDGPAANKSKLRESGDSASEGEDDGTERPPLGASSSERNQHSSESDGAEHDRAGGGTASGDTDPDERDRDAGAKSGPADDPA